MSLLGSRFPRPKPSARTTHRKIQFDRLEARLALAGVDLQGWDTYATDSAQWGQAISVQSAIRNAGTSTSGAFQVQWYLSRDSLGSGDDLLLTRTGGAGTSYGHAAVAGTRIGPDFTVNLQLPAAAPAGWSGTRFYVVMKTDSANQVAETNENNNFGQVGLIYDFDAITIAAPARPDLRADLADGPTSAVAGATVAVTSEVDNLGAGASGAFGVAYYLSTNAVISTSDTLLKTVSRPTLAGGSSQRWTESVTLPAATAPGAYYLGIIADPANAVAESNEDNNTVADTGTIAVAPQIDLRADLADGPSGAVPGATVAVAGKVDNLGAGASGAFSVAYYLSTDATITTADTLLKTVSRPGLAGGGTQTWTEAVTLPATTRFGPSYLGILVDSAGAIAETNEANNARADAQPIIITAPVLIDLLADLVDATVGGGAASVTSEVDNLGTSASGAFSVGYYLSTDPAITTADTLLRTVSRPGIAGGSSQRWTESVPLPAALNPGTYYLGIVVDPAGAIAETNESNNARADADPITVSPPVLVDLLAHDIDGPDTAVVGASVAVSSDVDNLGSSPSGAFSVAYYLSTDATITAADTPLKTVSRPGIAGGASQTWTETVTLPATAGPGSYFLGFVVDPANSIAETNESNNARADAAPISLTAAPTAVDLLALVVDGPSTAAAGATVAVSADVDNLGTRDSGAFSVGYYLSTDATITTADTLLKTVSRPSVAGGTFQRWTESVTLPASASPSTYYLGIVVDPAGAIAETNESNNARADDPITLTPAAGQVDLQGAIAGATDAAQWGQTISVATAIRNAGSAASGAFQVQWYLSQDAVGTTSDLLLPMAGGGTSHGHASLAGNTTGTTFTVNLVLPAALPAGWSGTSFFVILRTDSAHQVVETNEDNNFGQLGDGIDRDPISITAPPPNDTFLLHSNRGATKRIYLDFDGDSYTGPDWNNGATVVTPAFSLDGSSAFSDAELARIRAIWERVAEDFLPFDVDVTTEFPGVEALRRVGSADTEWGIRVVIGGNGSWFGGAGGVAYVGSFNFNRDTPAYVFSANLSNGGEKSVAEAISHEVGHALGLDHDGRTSPAEEYYAGHGTGATGWAPIMGVGYYQPLTQWSRGEYANAGNREDDLAIITTRNGFGYRADDHVGTTATTADPLAVTGTSSLSGSGIIERNTDTDFFRFALAAAGTVVLNVNPAARGPNLDILAELYDAAGTLLQRSNPVDALNATISLALGAGSYLLKIDGIGAGNPATTGYSDYGSLGYYSITGTASGGATFRAAANTIQSLASTVAPPLGLLTGAILRDGTGVASGGARAARGPGVVGGGDSPRADDPGDGLAFRTRPATLIVPDGTTGGAGDLTNGASFVDEALESWGEGLVNLSEGLGRRGRRA